ncbi:uncharacterized protein V6R79_005800 [Siganus canaliculatus]
MFPAVFLLVALLPASSGEPSADSDTVVALAGQDVVLPCSFSSASSEFPWGGVVQGRPAALRGLPVPGRLRDPRDEAPGLPLQDQLHQQRAEAPERVPEDLQRAAVRRRDLPLPAAVEGQGRRPGQQHRGAAGAASEPKLSVVSVSGGTVTLQCEAHCWLPEPQIHFLDHQGTSIAAGPTERRQESSGCFTVTRTVTPQDATSRVTCRVHQAGTNQSRTAEILIPGACSGSWSLSSSAAVLEAVLLLLLLVVGSVLLLLWCRQCRAEKRPSLKSHPSDQNVASSAGENDFFLQTVSARWERNVPDEQLRRRVLQLEKQLQDSEETIRQLRSSRPFIRPSSSRPDPVSLTTPRPHSLPDALNLDQSRPTTRSSMKKHSSVHRSASDSQAHSGPKVSALLRRHSSVLPSNHRFSYLDDLKEESEHLLSESRKS